MINAASLRKVATPVLKGIAMQCRAELAAHADPEAVFSRAETEDTLAGSGRF